MSIKKGGLGKGLDALFVDNQTDFQSATGSEYIKISEIEPNKNQPRKIFDEALLQQLADSIREHGIIQPIIVRELPTGEYQIVAGERRWRAARIAGLTEVPIIIRDYDDTKTMEIALIENLQRENLNPIEEALGYQELMENFNMTQVDVSNSVGKSRSAIANTLRLLNLPENIKQLVQEGKLSSGHARALLAVKDENDIDDLAAKVVNLGLNVRDLEKKVKAQNAEAIKKNPTTASATTKKIRNSFYDEMQIALNQELHRKVVINTNENSQKGTIQIDFYSQQDLADIASRLANKFD
ncbi:MAG: ParB/RepB/Spo0J family partition protein [Oscillospiraceae bacterium]